MNNYLIDGETGRVITEDVRIFVTVELFFIHS